MTAATPRLEEYLEGIRARDRAVLGRALTLVESTHPQDRELAQELLAHLPSPDRTAYRIGVTGVPGAGKSTFIDSLGNYLVGEGRSVAVLAVDPSSLLSGGSILGDKTRMRALANHPNAFVRPSPSKGSLGGIADRTRETILIMEAAGYDVVLVETVGVGQSEARAGELVDFLLLLMLAGAGDELQGIKRGLVEVADLIAINKADGDNVSRALEAQKTLEAALRLMKGTGGGRAGGPDARVPVVTCSSTEGTGIKEIWALVDERLTQLTESGELERLRSDQLLQWMWSLVQSSLLEHVRTDPGIKQILPEIERNVRSGSLAPGTAAQAIIDRAMD